MESVRDGGGGGGGYPRVPGRSVPGVPRARRIPALRGDAFSYRKSNLILGSRQRSAASSGQRQAYCTGSDVLLRQGALHRIEKRNCVMYSISNMPYMEIITLI